MPSTELTAADLTDGTIGILSLLVKTGLCPSNGEARRLVAGGGVAIDDKKVEDPALMVEQASLEKGIVVKKGKKVFHKVVLK